MDALFDLREAVVVITGAAGQLGAQYAGVFLARGARVVGLDLRAGSRVEAIAIRHPDRFRFIVADVTDKSTLQSAAAEIEATFGAPSVLINNAALDSPPSALPSESGPFEEYPEESWDRVLNVNLKGVFLSCQVFGSRMATAGTGSIINVASIYGLVSPDQALYDYRRLRGEVFYKPVAYAASKSGIYNLTRYLAVYWAKRGVRVNTITIAGVFNHQEREFLDAYTSRIPTGRMANVDDYDGAMVFLASDGSRYMTGANLVIDGGWTAI